ncbi:MAG: AAA family ATPase [Eubacterium sp.]|nr:AAA family ATPase [Eubacterium sp.]
MPPGVLLRFNQKQNDLEEILRSGKLILAYYKDKRTFQAEMPEHVEKVKLKERYQITETPGRVFIKYLLDMKVTEALARNNGNNEKADKIGMWFLNFEQLLQRIFEDTSLRLIFEEDTFSFLIQEENRELFDFYSLSSGFAAILDIVLDLMLRMEAHNQKTFDFTMPGIVLIDEIETHLHINLQRSILDLLTTIFPNIQFVITTHSPYILNSVENCVIYDLEKNIRVEDMSGYSAEGIVEGYFESEAYSKILLDKIDRYKVLSEATQPTEEERIERANLRTYLKQLSGSLAREARDAFEDIEKNRRKYGKVYSK